MSGRLITITHLSMRDSARCWPLRLDIRILHMRYYASMIDNLMVNISRSFRHMHGPPSDRAIIARDYNSSPMRSTASRAIFPGKRTSTTPIFWRAGHFDVKSAATPFAHAIKGLLIRREYQYTVLIDTTRVSQSLWYYDTIFMRWCFFIYRRPRWLVLLARERQRRRWA